jgi:glutamate 5-kinase
MVTLVEADLLILLSHIKGLYTADPTKDASARFIPQVSVVDQGIWDVAGGTETPFGTGGMYTKIEAAHLVQRSGATMVIADGNEPDVLLRIMEGEPVGTRFLPISGSSAQAQSADVDLPIRLESRKRWILAGSQALGQVYVDRGAAEAVVTRGKSLLAVGVVDVRERFERGETVRIFCDQLEIARGVVRYSSDELAQIVGLHSKHIKERLGYDYGDEIVHHNDMVILVSDIPPETLTPVQ